MSDIDQQVLQANEAFYQAFANTDIEAMEKLWSNKHEIAVIHPGSPVLHGRELVISSWQQIMESGHSFSISCLDAKVCLLDKFAFVTCTEELQDGHLIATNIFAMEDGDWKMIHHQAGPLSEPMVTEVSQSIH